MKVSIVKKNFRKWLKLLLNAVGAFELKYLSSVTLTTAIFVVETKRADVNITHAFMIDFSVHKALANELLKMVF